MRPCRHQPLPTFTDEEIMQINRRIELRKEEIDQHKKKIEKLELEINQFEQMKKYRKEK